MPVSEGYTIGHAVTAARATDIRRNARVFCPPSRNRFVKAHPIAIYSMKNSIPQVFLLNIVPYDNTCNFFSSEALTMDN